MAVQRLGVIMHGVTGRMGYNQHLVRSIAGHPRRAASLCRTATGCMPDPILVGRNAEKIEAIAEARYRPHTTDLDAPRQPDDTIFFDAGSTQMRVELLKRAIAAGKHVYCEKPISETLAEALSVARLAAESAASSTAWSRTSCSCPGLRKLPCCAKSGFFGRSSRCAASSATGCSKAMCSPRSVRPGTTARPTAAA
jgi:predicted dehydrogenase